MAVALFRTAQLTDMRDLETIDAELRLLAVARRFACEEYGVRASTRLEDALLDERNTIFGQLS